MQMCAWLPDQRTNIIASVSPCQAHSLLPWWRYSECLCQLHLERSMLQGRGHNGTLWCVSNQWGTAAISPLLRKAKRHFVFLMHANCIFRTEKIFLDLHSFRNTVVALGSQRETGWAKWASSASRVHNTPSVPCYCWAWILYIGNVWQ